MKKYIKPELVEAKITTSPIASLGEWLEENQEYGTEENITTFQVAS